jgi:hypothetical protein
MAVVHQALNEPVSSGVWKHAASKIDASSTSTSVGKSPETVQTEEFVVRSDVYVAPGAYAKPQTVDLLNVQEHTPPSQLEETEAEGTSTLKTVDVFSLQEILNTSTPEYFTGILDSSSQRNWHFLSPPEAQYNSLPSSKCTLQSSFKYPSSVSNWHTPDPADYAQKASKEDKVVHSGSTSNSTSPREEEGEVLVDIVNREFIAQHLEKCSSGFICKVCNKQYKCSLNVRIISKVIWV